MTADPFYGDPSLAAFYDVTCTADREDFERCLKLAQGGRSVLDLGCGTGTLCVGMADIVPRVVGVDPAAPMLDVARSRPGAAAVHWIEGDATQLSLEEDFDLIVMTGNAFQCLLSETAQSRLFDRVRRHLSQGGRFVFDSRNPAGFRPWTRDTTFRTMQTGDGRVLSWWVTVAEGQSLERLGYTQHFQLGHDRIRSVTSYLRFTSPEEMMTRLHQAGLTARLFGGWRGQALTQASVDIVCEAGLA